MVSHDPYDNPDDFLSEEFTNDGSNYNINDLYPNLNAFNVPAEGVPTDGLLNNPHHYTGFDFATGELSDLDFANGAQAPLAAAPLDISDWLEPSLFSPSETQAESTSDAADAHQSGLGLIAMEGLMSTSTPLPIPVDNTPFNDHLISSSVPHNLHSALTPAGAYPDISRARSSSYPAPTTAAHPTPSIFHPPHPGATFQVPYQHPHPQPPAPAPGVTHHIISYTWMPPQGENESSISSATVYPTASSPSASSPHSSTCSLSGSPSSSSTSLSPLPSTSRTTFRWRLDSSHRRSGVSGHGETWHCMCEQKTQKKKRHLESCPSNPNKPTMKCPYCEQIFKGGSRRSAAKKHIKKFHKKEDDERKRKGGK